MSIINLKTIEEKELIPGFSVRFVHSEKVTIAYWNVLEGSSLPEHAHIYEQVTHVVKGTFELTIDGQRNLLEPGMVAIIPPNVKHSGSASTDCEIIDVFCPVREDYK